ncbi:MAG TPA: purine-nucleoside phosphorylase [Dongiaceae bacterium]|jgi:purine-nucleoside phosphorylase|nr:purine-nucleoside phosphorylase [Dongiaceae bacterium]
MEQAATILRQRLGAFTPGHALVLGSGLGPLADRVEDPIVVSYAKLPGFPQGNVAGHAGRIVAGKLFGAPVLVLQGRAHYYEHGRADVMKPVIRALREIGCENLILTNAAGSLRLSMPPGAIMLVQDHLNLTGVSPLFGESGNDRFVDMTEAYDRGLYRRFGAAARKTKIKLHYGIYAWLAGPQFETPAEIKVLRLLKANAVGMSTVPEVILARHAGLKVAALSLITNFGAGMSPERPSHAQTIAAAASGLENMAQLLQGFFEA